MVMKEKFWHRLVDRLDLPALGDDARFRTFTDRLANRAALVPLVAARMRERTTAEWLERLRGHVPVAPVYTVAEALADEQVHAREMLVDVPHPVFGILRQVGSPLKIAGVRPSYRAASALGGDTDAILAEVGLDADAVASLRASGVV